MKRCSTCRGKGFIESTYAKNATFYPSLRKCPAPGCPHEEGFNREVAKRYAKVNDPNTEKSPDHKTCIHGNPIIDNSTHEFGGNVEPSQLKPMPVVDYVPAKVQLPQGFAESFDKMKDESADAVLVLSTNIGKCIVDSVEQAEDLLVIVDKYVQHGELLDWCNQFDNVTVFPLPRRLKAQ